MDMTRLSLLAAALAMAALLLGHDAVGQTSQAPDKDASSSPPAVSPIPAEWHTITGPDASFTADMPAAPAYTTTQMRTAGGSNYTMHQYLVEQGETAWVVQTAIYPADVNVSNQRTNLQGGLDNAAKGMDGGKWGTVGWVTHQGLTAVDATGVRGNNAIRSFSVMKGRQIVSLTYAGPSGSAASSIVDRFIGSLRVGR
jgi:hypothetical protein